MSNVISKAQSHFKSKLNGELQKISVPEWETDIYFKTAHSFAVESKILELQQANKTVEALVESVIAKSLDPDGKPLFTKFDKVTMMNEVDPKVLIRVASKLNSAISEYQTVEETAKN
jgi:hypothetical protein